MRAKLILRGMRWLLTVLLFALAAAPAQAQIYELSKENQDFRVDMRVRQDFDLGFTRRYGPGERVQDTGEEYLAEPVFNYDYLNWIRLKLDLNLWGDWVYGARQSPPRHGAFGTQNDNPITGKEGVFVPYHPTSDRLLLPDTCFFGDCNNFLRDYLIREASVTFSDRESGYNVTLGKFQRGWGEADGLRLMDVINPLDLRKRFLMRDFDELRIEQWMADFTIYADAFTKIFERIGIRNPSAEFIWIPNVRHDEFRVNNEFQGWGGGVWGFDLEDREFSPKGPAPDRVHHRFLPEPLPDTWWTWRDPALAGRIAWRTWDTDLTVNGYYGRQELPISNFASLQICGRIDGTLCSKPIPAGIAVHLLRPTRPPYAQRTHRLFNINSLCQIPGFCLPFPGSPQSAIANIEFQYPYRRLIGATLTRELSLIRLPPKEVSPVLRVETSYEFHKAFNTVDIVNTADLAQVRHDFWSTLVGIDYFLWLPDAAYGNFIFNRPHAIYTSLQMFFFKTLGDGTGVRQVLFQAPYAAWKRPHDGEYWFTFVWNTDVERDLIHLDGLNIYQFQPDSYVLRQRALLNYFGDHVKPGLEIGYFEGASQAGLGGLLKRNSYIDFIFLYQF